MPSQLEDPQPKGQERGAKQEQQAFTSQTTITPNVANVQINEPPPPPQEPTAPINTDLGEGPIDLMSVLLGPSQRPDEDVTAGVPGVVPPAAKVSDTLRGILQGVNAPDVEALANLATDLGL